MVFLAFLCKFLINCGKVKVVAKNENGESEKEVIGCSTPSNVLPFFVTAETGSVECSGFAALSTLLINFFYKFLLG